MTSSAYGIKLFVDDLRTPPPGWALATTITEAVRLLETGFVSVLSLDHDIAGVGKNGFSEETFATVARYVAVMPAELRPQRVYVHTANELAGEAMTCMLRDKVTEINAIHQDGAQTYVEQLQSFEESYER